MPDSSPPGRVLLIKTSSLGDVIHALPALTDAGGARPELRFDWVVEENFAEIPGWHPQVDRVIPVALRRWRRRPWRAWRGQEWRQFRRELGAREYACVLDAQGLLKSALLCLSARGPRKGLAWRSAREPLASLAYHQRISVPRDQHAVTRLRQLFAAALGYPPPETPPDYGLNPAQFSGAAEQRADERPVLVFLHGTTWPSKHWPEPFWRELIRLAEQDGFAVRLPWGNESERQRAERLVRNFAHAELIPPGNLHALAGELSRASAVVGVDSGPAHLAAALNIPSITLYGATRPDWTGVMGPRQVNLQADFPCAPCLRRECTWRDPGRVSPACFGELPPTKVWNQLHQLKISID